MGYMRHHAIVVTSMHEEYIKKAHAKALGLFGLASVSPIIGPDSHNGYRSFFVPPDGSKEGWPASDEGDRKRDKFVTWLREQYYDDGGTSTDWVEIQYGDEEHEAALLGSGDADTKYFRENYEETASGDWAPKAKKQ